MALYRPLILAGGELVQLSDGDTLAGIPAPAPAVRDWAPGEQVLGLVRYNGQVYDTFVYRANGTTPPGPTTTATYKLLGYDDSVLAPVAKTGSYNDLLNKPAPVPAYTDAQAQAANDPRFDLVEGDVNQLEVDLMALDNLVDGLETDIAQKLDARRLLYARTASGMVGYDTFHQAAAGGGLLTTQRPVVPVTQPTTFSGSFFGADSALSINDGVPLTLDGATISGSLITAAGTGSLSVVNNGATTTLSSGVLQTPLALSGGAPVVFKNLTIAAPGLWATGTGTVLVLEGCVSQDAALDYAVDVSKVGPGVNVVLVNTKLRELGFLFPSTASDAGLLVAVAADAGTYRRATLRNAASVVAQVNGVPVALPFAVADLDEVSLTITRSDPTKAAYVLYTP